jgi:DNA gyrase subunit A
MTQFAKETVAVSLEEEMRRSYLDYAMSVIVGRALPDARDGLKPVHRRVLFAMHELNNHWNRPYKKSARIVGDVIGKYHPHGDTAVYDTIVRMAQDFSLRHMLVDGQGNFGSVDGDNAAAMRYTEIRLSKIADEMLADIDKETVDFAPNYDGSEKEPTVLPARLPNLLVNGSGRHRGGHGDQHPAAQPQRGRRRLPAPAEEPEATVDELMEIVPAPDFPTAGIIYGLNGRARGLPHRPRQGVMRAKAHFEDIDKGARQAIIVDEIPYQVNKKTLLERIAELVHEKKLEGISHIQDESDKSGMRVVIELKRGEVPEVVLNNLYKQTQLQDTFGINMVALIDGQPRLCNLKQLIEIFLEHRREVVTRRTVFELRKARERGHVLEGLAVALANIDEFIETIKTSPTPPVAKAALMGKSWDSSMVREMLARAEPMAPPAARPTGPRACRPTTACRPTACTGCRDDQAQEILQMRLQRLTGLEQDKIIGEYREVMAQIADLLDILARPERVTAIIAGELTALRQEFGQTKLGQRRSLIERNALELGTEDLITPADMVVTLSHTGYVKSQALSEYRAQRRGGRGKQATQTKEDDWIDQLFIANTHDWILCFSDRGRVYWLKVWEVPQGSAGQPRQAHRQHVPAAAGREDHRGAAADRGVPQLPGRPLRLHVHRAGHGQEDRAGRVQQPAQGRHHRRRPGRGRLPDRRGAHRRQARRDAVQRRRQGGALRRGRRAGHGPHGARRARHGAGARPEGDRDAGRRGRDAERADRHRERLRQAHLDRRVHAPRPRHQGHDRHPAERAQRPRRGRHAGARRPTRSC